MKRTRPFLGHFLSIWLYLPNHISVVAHAVVTASLNQLSQFKLFYININVICSKGDFTISVSLANEIVRQFSQAIIKYKTGKVKKSKDNISPQINEWIN